MLSGRIVSEHGGPLQGAEVRLICGPEIVVTVSAASGEFTFQGLQNDASCHVDVSAPGHAAQVVSMDQFIAEEHVLNLRSTESSRFDTLVVVANRISRPFATIYLPALAVLANPSARGDALMAVATTPHSSTVGESPDLRLRGSPAGTVGLFLGEVPLYETFRGVGLVGRSNEPSALGSGLPYDIEIYPNNPPLYLTNTGTAAVRLMPSKAPSSSLSLLTAGVAGKHTLTHEDVSLDASGSWSNMGAMLALNPALADTLKHSKTATGNLLLNANAGRFGDVQAFLLADQEHGAYPLAVLSSQGTWRNQRRRSLATTSWQRRVGDAALKLNGGITRSRGEGSFRSWSFSSDNDFRFVSLDASSDLRDGRVHYRTGAAVERIRLDHVGAARRFEPLWNTDFPPNLPMRRSRRLVHGGIFGFGTWQVSERTLLMAGARHHFGMRKAGRSSWQVGVTHENLERNAAVTIAAGQYHAFRMPLPSQWHVPVPFRSRQVALDSRLSTSAADLTASVFSARLEEAARQVDLHGIDLSARWQIGDVIVAHASVLRARQFVTSYGQRFRGAGDTKLLFRGGFDLTVGRSTVTVNYIRGSGSPYTEVVGRRPSVDDSAAFLAIFSDEANGANLGSYQRLDASLATPVRIGERIDALALLAVSNALDRRNPKAKAYSLDFEMTYDIHYPPRVFVAGLVFLF